MIRFVKSLSNVFSQVLVIAEKGSSLNPRPDLDNASVGKWYFLYVMNNYETISDG